MGCQLLLWGRARFVGWGAHPCVNVSVSKFMLLFFYFNKRLINLGLQYMSAVHITLQGCAFDIKNKRP